MYTFLHYLTLSFVSSYQLRCPLSTFPALPFLCTISDAHIVSQVFCTACEASRFMLTNFHIFHPSSARESYSDLCSVPSSSNDCFKAPHLRLLHFFTYLPCCFCGCTLNFLSATNTFFSHVETHRKTALATSSITSRANTARNFLPWKSCCLCLHSRKTYF